MKQMIALTIAIFGIVVAGLCFFILRSYMKNIKQKIICYTIGTIGALIYLSYIICAGVFSTISSREFAETYEIEKITLGPHSIRFNGTLHDIDSNSNIIIEEPDDIHNNVVVKENVTYFVNWIIDFNINSRVYHVYMSEDVYAKYINSNVIYEQ